MAARGKPGRFAGTGSGREQRGICRGSDRRTDRRTSGKVVKISGKSGHQGLAKVLSYMSVCEVNPYSGDRVGPAGHGRWEAWQRGNRKSNRKV